MMVLLMVSLVVDNIPMVADEVVDSDAPEEHAKEAKWQRPRLLWLPVVPPQHQLHCLGLLFSNQISNSILISNKRRSKNNCDF
jgi:hypothetical protein